MWANKPAMAKKWEKHTPKGEKLPEHIKKADLELTSAFTKMAEKLVKGR
jgi:hypothetical protein